MTAHQTWAQRIQRARDARIATIAAEEQTVRDAAADGATPTDIVAAYGTRNRQRVYAILRANPAAPQRPITPPTIYLHGAGCGQPTWDRVEHAMWARGWDTTHDRTTAWHLARGGAAVVFCDFSSAMAGGLSSDHVTVGRVRAKYEETTELATVGALLDTKDVVRLVGQRWLEEQVTQTVTDLGLPLVNGGEQPRPRVYDPDARNRMGHPGVHVLDADALARMVAEVLEEQ
jgi:hypothetical protein